MSLVEKTKIFTVSLPETVKHEFKDVFDDKTWQN